MTYTQQMPQARFYGFSQQTFDQQLRAGNMSCEERAKIPSDQRVGTYITTAVIGHDTPDPTVRVYTHAYDTRKELKQAMKKNTDMVPVGTGINGWVASPAQRCMIRSGGSTPEGIEAAMQPLVGKTLGAVLPGYYGIPLNSPVMQNAAAARQREQEQNVTKAEFKQSQATIFTRVRPVASRKKNPSQYALAA